MLRMDRVGLRPNSLHWKASHKIRTTLSVLSCEWLDTNQRKKYPCLSFFWFFVRIWSLASVTFLQNPTLVVLFVYFILLTFITTFTATVLPSWRELTAWKNLNLVWEIRWRVRDPFPPKAAPWCESHVGPTYPLAHIAIN